MPHSSTFITAIINLHYCSLKRSSFLLLHCAIALPWSFPPFPCNRNHQCATIPEEGLSPFDRISTRCYYPSNNSHNNNDNITSIITIIVCGRPTSSFWRARTHNSRVALTRILVGIRAGWLADWLVSRSVAAPYHLLCMWNYLHSCLSRLVRRDSLYTIPCGGSRIE